MCLLHDELWPRLPLTRDCEDDGLKASPIGCLPLDYAMAVSSIDVLTPAIR